MCIVSGTGEDKRKLNEKKYEKRSTKKTTTNEIRPYQVKSDTTGPKRSQRSKRKNYNEDIKSDEDDDKSWSGESASEADGDDVSELDEKEKSAKKKRNSISEYSFVFAIYSLFIFSRRRHCLVFKQVLKPRTLDGTTMNKLNRDRCS